MSKSTGNPAVAEVAADRADLLRAAPEVEPPDGWPAFPDPAVDCFWTVGADA